MKDPFAEEKKVPPFEEQEEAFADTFFQAALGATMLQTAYIGYNLGWYSALKKAGSNGMTANELASATDSSSRYAREWLEQQTVSGWLECSNPIDAAEKRQFILPAAHANVLANPDSLSYLIPISGILGGTGKKLTDLVKAYKNDTGVSWDDYGDDAREAMAALNRPFFLQGLGSALEKCLDSDTISKLNSDKGRVADIGCGYAFSSIGVAKHFQKCIVDAYDLDKPSIDQAQVNIESYGLKNRVAAYCMDAASIVSDKNFKPYDLVIALECVHDMSDPISVLKTMRELAGNKGTVIVMDERVADNFAKGIRNPVDQLNYGFSCVCCLAGCKSRPSSAETGAVMRPSIFKMYVQQAGFRDIAIMPVENDFFYFYKLLL